MARFPRGVDSSFGLVATASCRSRDDVLTHAHANRHTHNNQEAVVMGFIKVTAEDLLGVAGQLTAAASAIDGENARAVGQVNGLVGAGWEGAASAQFDALFTQWKSGADQVHNALSQIAYAQTEDQIQASMRA
jgi:WXG100 family type VII secretion target